MTMSRMRRPGVLLPVVMALWIGALSFTRPEAASINGEGCGRRERCLENPRGELFGQAQALLLTGSQRLVRAMSADSAENSARLGSISRGDRRAILLASDGEGRRQETGKVDFNTGHHCAGVGTAFASDRSDRRSHVVL
jgi:hypothetical protein